MSDKEDYLTSYRMFFEDFAATVNPEDQLPVNIAGYTITEAEVPGEVLYWITQYLAERQCPLTLMTPLRRIILDEVLKASKKQPNEFGYKADESVYIALRLMQAVTARVNDVCLRYLDNSRLDSLPAPPPLDQRELTTVSAATKNSRRVMEDRHVEIGNLEALFGIETSEPTSFYAVYDGHAGSAAATYCAAHLHQYLVESVHFRRDLERALVEAYIKTDVDFVRKSNEERANGGSTAVSICIRGRTLTAAWAGDSLALLAKRMRLMQLVRPHKPARQDERERIESSGGTVIYWGTWRVNGQLAVSRAIGDAQYKPYVTAKPEIATIDLDGDEDFVVVACDGLWDFVSEDDVALAVYRQLAADPDDLKAVTRRLILLAKRQGSSDNISIIVVFLKNPRDIVADNSRPPMDLGLDNVLNAPPFAVDSDACKRQETSASADADAADMDGADAESEAADNGVDNSDSDSEDLGPETAVDADDIDAEPKNHEPAPPTPPAHTVGGPVDAGVVDNVAESGEESEDEWNYFKGGDGETDRNPDEPDELPHSDTPCQDNSAWETSSVDMNSSPLNPDAPVFVPGTVAGADVLLAESPRKPLPMDDIELPDSTQFQTEAVVRPAELLDLDNCDQLNGHHNVSIEEAAKERFNGNEKLNMGSLGFGFDMDIEPGKGLDKNLVEDFERIQRDTTDFCNIQVLQAHTETNPFSSDGINEEYFERLKNKERDPMSMSFYQEKDDDTCERLGNNDLQVDLNAVQLLPDSDDEDLQQNGICGNVHETEKENVDPDHHADLLGAGINPLEPNNDIIKLEGRIDLLSSNFGQGDNFMDYNPSVTNNADNFSNIDFEPSNVQSEPVLQTDTPESHKLMFEQIPEIPDGKSSELGFTNEDIQDPSESEKDARAFTPQEEVSQDIEMESKRESPCIESHLQLEYEDKEEQMESTRIETERIASAPTNHIEDQNEIILESALEVQTHIEDKHELSPQSPVLNDTGKHEVISPEPTHDIQENITVDVHQNMDEPQDYIEADVELANESDLLNFNERPPSGLSDKMEAPQAVIDTELSDPIAEELLRDSPLPTQSPLPAESPAPIAPHAASPLPAQSPLLAETADSLPPTLESAASPLPVYAKSSAPIDSETAESPLPVETHGPHAPSPVPAEVPLPRESPLPRDAPVTASEDLLQTESVLRPETASPKIASPVPDNRVTSPVTLKAEEIASAPVEEPSFESRLTPVVPADSAAPEAGPAPDIVPEQPRAPLITDIDIGVPESRAQEICVPVTSEIQPDEPPPRAATPPPTPAAPSAEPALPADVVAPVDAAAATALAAGAVAAAVSKSKTPAKKTTTTPTRTPSSATKLASKPTSATRTPLSAAKKPAPTTPAPKTPARTPSTAAKPTTPAVKLASPATKTVPARPAATKPSAPKAPVTKSAPAKEAPAAVKSATTARAAPTARPAPRPATARPASAPSAKPAAPAASRPPPIKAPVARPTPRPAPAKPKEPIAKAPEKKQLTNGDVKPIVKRAPSAPRPAPVATRVAPKPTPRAPAAVPPPAAAKSSVPKPAPRASRPALDKQSKDLANKRLTTKAAPPRTATTKAPPSNKNVPTKITGKKPVEAKKATALSIGLANGEESLKAPPSPPADAALLPDVIA